MRGAQNAPVLACSMPRKPAPMLALRGAVATTRVRPTAFGNALGSSIADGMQPESGIKTMGSGPAPITPIEHEPIEVLQPIENVKLADMPDTSGLWAGNASASPLSGILPESGPYSNLNTDQARQYGFIVSDVGDGIGDGPYAFDTGKVNPAAERTAGQLGKQAMEKAAETSARQAATGAAQGGAKTASWLETAAPWIRRGGTFLTLLLHTDDGPATKWEAAGTKFSFTSDDGTVRMTDEETGRRFAVSGIENPRQYTDAQYLSFVSYKANGGELASIEDFVGLAPNENAINSTRSQASQSDRLSDLQLPGMSRAVRLPNPAFPPNAAATDAMASPLIQRMAEATEKSDCSEIAMKLQEAAEGSGYVLRVDPKIRFHLNVLENGEIKPMQWYHEVYTDGRYVFDPRISAQPVPEGDWYQHMHGINPDGVDIYRKKQ